MNREIVFIKKLFMYNFQEQILTKIYFKSCILNITLSLYIVKLHLLIAIFNNLKNHC